MKEVLMIPSVLPTVQLFLFLGAIVSLAWLVMKYLTQQGSEAGKKPSIHLYYLIGIGSLLLIELVTYILTGVGDVSRAIFDQISFASTISSILLSVIAIIYSIVSGSNGANLYVKTEEVSKQIGETLSDLRDLGTTVEKLEKIPDDIEKHLRELKEQMQRMEEISKWTSQQLDQEVVSRIKKLSEDVDAFASKGGSHTGTKDSKYAGEDREDIFRYYISRSSFLGGLMLLGCCYAGKKKKKIDLQEMTCQILGEGSISILWYLLGYAIASSALGILDVKFDEEKMELRVKEVYNKGGFDLEKVSLDFLNEVIGEILSEELKSLREQQVKSVKSYFGIEEE